MPSGTVVAFHAHPDDEALLDAGTLTRAAQAGHRVVLVFATRGGAGDVGDGVLNAGEALAERRSAEAEASAAVIGAARVVFLDYQDSGHAPDANGMWPDGTFCAASIEAAADGLVAILSEEDAVLLIADDRNGGYGHPDHIQAHRVTTAAVGAAADRWRVPKFYWTVTSANAFRAGIDSLGPEDVRPDWIRLPPEVSYGFPDDRITAVIDAAEHLPAKVAAIGAHATQMVLGPTGRAFTLSNNVILPVLSQEHYLLVSGRPGATDDKGWEHDLLAGIDFTAE